MTQEDILRLEGPALTRLAYHLDLAPEGVVWCDDWIHHDIPNPCWEEKKILCPYSRPWHPHKDVVQADALFRDLRVHPSIVLETRTASSAKAGWCEVGRYGGFSTSRIYWGAAWEEFYARKGLPCEKTEAMALVRVSVLAVILLGGDPQ